MSNAAGVAHIDLLQLFTSHKPQGDSEGVFSATQKLEDSNLLVSKHLSTTLRPHAVRRQNAYTLRLPLECPKTASTSILAGMDPEPPRPDSDGKKEYIEIIVEPADMSQIEESFWAKLVALVDWDSSGTLDKEVSFQRPCFLYCS